MQDANTRRIPARQSQLVVALDISDSAGIPRIVASLPAEVTWYKIGLELFCRQGPGALDWLREHGKNIFLDLKLHDIPRTVARAVKSIAAMNVGMITLHAGGGRAMLKAADEARREFGAGGPVLVAVTTLTSLDADDLRQMGVNRPLLDHAVALGRMAVDAGTDGLVCSPLEAGTFRSELGAKPVLVTPGIRPAGSAPGDQKRVACPAQAVEAGTDFLVVGRPILEAQDPHAAATTILREIAETVAIRAR